MAQARKKSSGTRSAAGSGSGGGWRLVAALVVAGLVAAGIWFGRELVSPRPAPRPAEPAPQATTRAPRTPGNGSPGQSAAAQGNDQAAAGSLEDAVKRYAAVGRVSIAPSDYRTSSVDLQGNGHPDELVMLHGPSFCGSCGCTLLVFEHRADGYRLVSDISCVGPAVSVGNNRSHGWRDLVVGTEEPYVLHFDGRTYPPSPQDGERAVGRVEGGTVLFAQSAH